MSKLNLIPVSNHIVVKRDDPETVTKGGIHLPDSVRDKKPVRGKVLAVGPGKIENHNGAWMHKPMGVTEGNAILFSQYGGQEVELDGEKYTIITEDDMVALLGA